jgi:hypothetical protein
MSERCPEPIEGCKYFETEHCILTTHHIYWPKKLYRDSIGKIFRELPENKQILEHCLHDELHANESQKVKPGREEMLAAIGRLVMGEGDETEMAS